MKSICRLWKKTLQYVVLGAFPVLSYQACTQNFSTKNALPQALSLLTDQSQNENLPKDPLPPDDFDSPTTLEGKALYTQNCASCHGAFEITTKNGRTLANIAMAIKEIPQMGALKNLKESELNLISEALNLIAKKTGGANPFVCKADQDPGISELQRLSRREYIQTLEDLVDGQFALADLGAQLDLLPADTVTTTFDSMDSSISGTHPQAYFAVAKRVSELLVAKPQWIDSVTQCSVATQGMTTACWNRFFSHYAMRVFRRPLTSTEQSQYKAIFEKHQSDGVATALGAVVQTLLQSPHFIYKIETQGEAITGRDDLLRLNVYELASKLAFLATGKGPTLELLNDAVSGKLSTANGYKEAVNRLFSSAHSKKHLKEFYNQWLGVNRMPASNHTDWFLGRISKNLLRSEALLEVDEYVTHFTWENPGTYRDLFLSEKNFTRGPALAGVYNVSLPDAGLLEDQVIEAERMNASVGQAEDGGWNLFSNGTLTQQIQVTTGKSYTLVVRARASVAQNIGAHMILRFNNQVLGQVFVTAASYADFSFVFSPEQASGNLVVEFDNDVYDPATNLDRNLYVDKITLKVPNATAPGNLSENHSTGERSGLLSRAALLMSGTNQSSLVHRGLVIRKNILCDKISNPIINENEKELFAPPEANPLESMRSQIEDRTSPNRCQACHSMINPPGFVLENYDGLGRHRLKESVFDLQGKILATHSVNAQVYPNIEGTGEAMVDGLSQYARAITESSKGPACMVQQWFAFNLGREPSLADSCTLSHLYQSLLDQNYPSASEDKPATLLNMFKSLAFDEKFKTRKVHSPEN